MTTSRRHSFKCQSSEDQGYGLRQFFGLLAISNAKGVKVAAAPNLELGDCLRLLDLHRSGVLAAPFGESHEYR